MTNCKIHVVDGYGSRKIAFVKQGIYAYAYVINSSSNTVSVYQESDDGSLSTFSDPDFAATGGNPTNIRVTDKYMYVVNSSENTISVYQIDRGTLSLLATKPIPTGSHPIGLAISQLGYAYITDVAQGTISTYVVNSDGTLSPKEITSGLRWPIDIALDASSSTQYIYAINGSGNHDNPDDDTISMYKIDGSTGTLIKLQLPHVLTGKTPSQIILVNFATQGFY